jgi:endoglucanase
MQETLLHLKKWISLPGLSGAETPLRQAIHEAWQPLADEFNVSAMGSLHALKKGSAPLPRPSVMVSTHMDAIGLMVTGIEKDWLRITQVGWVDARILPGQQVIVHAARDLPGVVVQPPAHLLLKKEQEGPVSIEQLLIDTGLTEPDLRQLVKVGDFISFSQPWMELSGQTLAGHSLDNRASVAALTHCLELLQTRDHAWDVWAVASVQEEIGHFGASTSAFQLRPNLAVAVDVTFASGPGTQDPTTFALNSGPALGCSSVIHPALYERFRAAAQSLEMPYNKEIMAGLTHTDADDLQIVGGGIPTMVVSIPLRYMHTPVEVVAIQDIERTGRLLAEFICQLTPDALDSITWDD